MMATATRKVWTMEAVLCARTAAPTTPSSSSSLISSWRRGQEMLLAMVSQLAVYLYNPLLLTLAASVLLFVPLMGRWIHLEHSLFEQFVTSAEHRAFVANALCAALPLLLDIFLDWLSSRGTEFLLLRSLSLFSLAFSMGMMLLLPAAPTILSLFLWGYFVEFGVIFSFLHALIPRYFTWPRTALLIGLVLVFSSAMLLNALDLVSSPAALNALFLVSFYLCCLVCGSISTVWLVDQTRLYRASGKPLLEWLRCLDGQDACTLVLLMGLASQAVLYVVMLNAISYQFSYVSRLQASEIWIIESSRTFLCIFTYMLPSRLFRARLLGAQKELGAKVEVVKYISHEFRTPLSILMVGLELIAAECTRLEPMLLSGRADTLTISDRADPLLVSVRALQETVLDARATCLDMQEVLDDLLMFERIERRAMHLTLLPLEPTLLLSRAVEAFRREADAVALSLTVDPPGPEDAALLSGGGGVRMLADGRALKCVFNALLHPALRSSRREGQVCLAVRVEGSSATTAGSTGHGGSSSVRWRSMRRSSQRHTHTEQQEGKGAAGAASGLLVCVVVRDGRSGVTLKDLGQLTQPPEERGRPLHFERLGHEDGSGSGFALWIARRVLDMHCASVAVEIGDTGATYILRFPATSTATAASQRPQDILSALPETGLYPVESHDPVGFQDPVDVLESVPSARVSLKVGPVMLSVKGGTGPGPGTGTSVRAGAPRADTLASHLPLLFAPRSTKAASIRRHTFDGGAVGSVRRRSSVRVSGGGVCLRVLVVDDSQMTRKMVVKLMSSLGHECAEAADGSAAVEQLRRSMEDGQRAFDVVLMDNQMPVMMGKDATRLIRSSLGYQGLVLGVTGNVTQEDVAEFEAHGADEVIAKPFTAEKFLQSLDTFAHSNNLSSVASSQQHSPAPSTAMR